MSIFFAVLSITIILLVVLIKVAPKRIGRFVIDVTSVPYRGGKMYTAHAVTDHPYIRIRVHTVTGLPGQFGTVSEVISYLHKTYGKDITITTNVMDN